MTDLPPQLQARRDIENEVLKRGAERSKLENDLTINTKAIVDLIPRATGVGLPFEQIAELAGVSRQTLYRWQEVVKRAKS
jgi:hypothetical protein